MPSVDILRTVGKINLQEYLLRSRGTLIKLPLMERAIERLTTNSQRDRAISGTISVYCKQSKDGTSYVYNSVIR